MEATARAQPQSCSAHPDVPHTGRCDRCERPLCETCVFRTAAGRLCAECMVDGASPESRRTSATQSVIGLLCAAGGVLCLLNVLGIIGETATRGGAGSGGLVLAVIAVVTALLGRDHGRKTGSPLSLISLIASAAVLAMFVLLMIIGLTR